MQEPSLFDRRRCAKLDTKLRDQPIRPSRIAAVRGALVREAADYLDDRSGLPPRVAKGTKQRLDCGNLAHRRENGATACPIEAQHDVGGTVARAPGPSQVGWVQIVEAAAVRLEAGMERAARSRERGHAPSQRNADAKPLWQRHDAVAENIRDCRPLYVGSGKEQRDQSPRSLLRSGTDHDQTLALQSGHARLEPRCSSHARGEPLAHAMTEVGHDTLGCGVEDACGIGI